MQTKNNVLKHGMMLLLSLCLVLSTLPILGAATSDLTQSFQQPEPLSRGTLYVGGNGSGNYSTIKEAIDAANQFDTIFVYNGTYNENVVIGKKLSLIGEDKNITIINGIGGADQVVNFVSSNIIVSGFTIRGNSGEQDGIRVFSLMEDCQITDNIFDDCADGILLQVTTKRINVHHNHIIQATFAGIHLTESDRNNIAYNLIESCAEWGIFLGSISSQNNVTGNTLIGNAGGIHLAGNSGQNLVNRNYITGSTKEAILVETLSSDNTLRRNTLVENYAGIKLSGSSVTIIELNHIENNSLEGVLLEFSNNNQIINNNFIGNRRQATLRFSIRNVWDSNYWDNWIGFKLAAPLFQLFPKVIIGLLRINFDRNPQQTPYIIP